MPRTSACERARVWALLLPDGELSLFERRLLEAHTKRCAECRAIAEGALMTTEILRRAPFEVPERQFQPIRLRTRPWRAISGAVASSAVTALAFALAVWVVPSIESPQERPSTVERATSPLIIVAQQQSRPADEQAIWRLKRDRTGTAAAQQPDTHARGAILS